MMVSVCIACESPIHGAASTRVIDGAVVKACLRNPDCKDALLRLPPSIIDVEPTAADVAPEVGDEPGGDDGSDGDGDIPAIPDKPEDLEGIADASDADAEEPVT